MTPFEMALLNNYDLKRIGAILRNIKIRVKKNISFTGR
jgi:hypothetical protein